MSTQFPIGGKKKSLNKKTTDGAFPLGNLNYFPAIFEFSSICLPTSYLLRKKRGRLPLTLSAQNGCPWAAAKAILHSFPPSVSTSHALPWSRASSLLPSPGSALLSAHSHCLEGKKPISGQASEINILSSEGFCCCCFLFFNGRRKKG